tara:strand:- start:521 stop:706 length:186 start_codon:yes stop_codon:yes gene_type:complete
MMMQKKRNSVIFNQLRSFYGKKSLLHNHLLVFEKAAGASIEFWRITLQSFPQDCQQLTSPK